jgi:hypothetical protein
MHCARFSLKVDKMGTFFIEILTKDAIKDRVAYGKSRAHISYTFVTIYYSSLSLIFVFRRVRKIAKRDY